MARAIVSDDENRVGLLRPPARLNARIMLRLDLLRCRTKSACCTYVIASSGDCPERSGCGAEVIVPGHACTTSVIASPSGRYSIGIEGKDVEQHSVFTYLGYACVRDNLLGLTCHCVFPPDGVRVRSAEGRVDEASKVFGRTHYRGVEGA